MKKALINGFLGIAFAFAMVACNGNASTEDTTAADTCEMEQAEEACMHHCQMTCPDSVCLAANCENCVCPEDSPCHKKPECKGEGNCCKKAEGEGCKKAEANGECCKKAEAEGCQHKEGCKKECENHKK